MTKPHPSHPLHKPHTPTFPPSDPVGIASALALPWIFNGDPVGGAEWIGTYLGNLKRGAFVVGVCGIV